jgi:TatD DNase family protein
MFIDSHAHLDGPRFDSDRDEVVTRAREAGISTILAIGIGDGPGTLDCAVKLAAQYDFIDATVGIHPHEAKLAKDSDFDELAQLAKRPKVIAWGEIGLDYYYDHSPRETQQTVFIRQIELARAAKLPIIIHCRASDKSSDNSSDKLDDIAGNAWDDCLSLIEQHWKPSGLGGILHCFTSSWFWRPCTRACTLARATAAARHAAQHFSDCEGIADQRAETCGCGEDLDRSPFG